MELIEAILNRRSVRQFKKKPVSREILEKLFERARWSPVAEAFRNYEYWVATGSRRDQLVSLISKNTHHFREALEQLEKTQPDKAARAVKFYSDLGNAPVVVVITVPSSDDDAWAAKWHHIRASLELMVLLYVIYAEGLGACGIALAPWVEEEIKKALKISPDCEVLCALALGYPDESPTVPSHPLAPVHYVS
jgi:hypothetical protein